MLVLVFVHSGVFTVPMATLACIMTSVYLLLPSSGPPPTNSTNEQLSSASIFEHVDRMSRGADASKRLPNKVQLIAMQPMPVPPPVRASGKQSDSSQINKEVEFFFQNMNNSPLMLKGRSENVVILCGFHGCMMTLLTHFWQLIANTITMLKKGTNNKCAMNYPPQGCHLLFSHYFTS